MNSPITLETACRRFTEKAKINPFNTWLIVENEDIRQRAFELIKTPVLQTRITTVKTLAHTLLKEQNTGIRIIPPEEQYLLFLRFSKDIFDKNSTAKTITENLIDLYITITINQKTCPTETEKGKNAAKVFSRYKNWCEEHRAADAITALCFAKDAAENAKPAYCLCYKLQSITPLAESLLIAFAPNAERIEPETSDTLLPETLQEVCVYKTLREEISAVLDTICHLEESGVAGSDITVLVPSLQTILPLFAETCAEFTVNNTLPLTFVTTNQQPIQNIPLIRAALAFATAANHPKETDLAAILECPQFSLHRRNIHAGTLRKAVKMTGCTEWRTLAKRLEPNRNHDWQKVEDENLQEILNTILDAAETRQSTARTLKDRIHALKADLDELGWTNAPAPLTEDTARTAFLNLLNRLETAKISDMQCGAAEFSAILARGCRKNAGIPYPENETAFRLGKIRGAAGTRTPYVFIINLTAKNLPNISATLPLLTVPETKALLPDRYRKAAEDTTYYLSEALKSATNALYLSYAESNGKTRESPSPYLTRLTEAIPAECISAEHSLLENQKRAGKTIANGKIPQDTFGIRDLNSTADRIRIENFNRKERGEYTAHFNDGRLNKDYTEKQVSATFLENYAACPFNWYLQNHLRLENPKNFSAENIKIGTVMHRVLERYFKKHGKIEEDKTNDAYEELISLLREEMDNTGIKTPSWKAKYLNYEGYTTESPIRQLIEYEAGLSAKGFTTPPEWIERYICASFEGITVSGIADRVILKDGCYQVIDYKTGKSKEKADVKTGTALQLPIYSAGISQETGMTPLCGNYIRIAPDSFETKSLFDNPETMIHDAANLIADIISRIRSGDCGVNPACKNSYCPAKTICRREEGGEDD